MTPQDILSFDIGDEISKPALYAMIVGSKKPGSPFWAGPDLQIGNTPMQGIHWIGPPDSIRAVLLKSRPGAYTEDGQRAGDPDAYDYAFKARKGRVNLQERANQCLLDQPEHGYPVILLQDRGDRWSCAGRFRVHAIAESFVTLQRL